MGASGAVLGPFFDDFRIWVGKRKTIEKHVVFVVFLALLGGLEEVSEHLGGCLRRCWLEGYVFQKFFGHVGDKRAISRGKMAT